MIMILPKLITIRILIKSLHKKVSVQKNLLLVGRDRTVWIPAGRRGYYPVQPAHQAPRTRGSRGKLYTW